MSVKVSKAQKKVLAKVESLGPSIASPSMIASDLNVKIKTVKGHLNNLEGRGLVFKRPCSFHDNTNVYEVSDEVVMLGLTK